MSPTRSAPASGLLLADDHAKQRGLAGAVRPDHADDAAGRQAKIEIVDQQSVAVALLEMLGIDHEVAKARPRRDHDLGAARRTVLGFAEQILVRGDARLALGLARARARPDPLQLARERLLARDLLPLLLGETLLLLLEPRAVVTLPGNAVAAVELQNPAGDIVEEVAIVGDRDHGARIVL